MGKFVMTEAYAFGPWILKISDTYPIPQLFKSYFEEYQSKKPLLFVKIPRNLDRQQIKGEIHLYEYVMAMYEDYIYLLKRAQNGVEESRISYSEIECVENFIDLLDGRLTIYLQDRKVEIKYNSVSEDIVVEIIELIRSKYTERVYSQAKMESLHLGSRMDDLYLTLLNKLEKEGNKANLIAMQPNLKIKKTNDSMIKKLFQLIFYKKMLSSVYLVTEKELIVINRGKKFKGFREAVYSYSHIYIPLENVLEIEKQSEEKYTNITKVEIKTQDYMFYNYFDSNNPLLKNIIQVPKIRGNEI